jgi:hypothetical protein
MSRGRANNTAYLYERLSEGADAAAQTSVVHAPWRGSIQQAAEALRMVATRDDAPISAHDVAGLSIDAALPIEVQRLAEKRRRARLRRQTEYRGRQLAIQASAEAVSASRDRYASHDEGLEL